MRLLRTPLFLVHLSSFHRNHWRDLIRQGHRQNHRGIEAFLGAHISSSVHFQPGCGKPSLHQSCADICRCSTRERQERWNLRYNLNIPVNDQTLIDTVVTHGAWAKWNISIQLSLSASKFDPEGSVNSARNRTQVLPS